ncbi:MAG: DUF4838 domain-containing protein [Lentisphaeria bacterium]|nr:DUF4838 domain-containing protein [Lentisphaeria bacterium]
MKKSILILMAAALFSTLAAAELTIAAGKKSDYQIVVPESCGNKTLDKYITLGGQVIRTALKKAAGVELPLVTESKMIPGKPAIFVGNTKAAAKLGLSSKNFDRWEHAIVVKGKDIYCYGKDAGNPYKKSNMFASLKYPDYFIHYTNGSLKAACTFAEKFLNTRFVIPSRNNYGEHEGVRTLPLAKVTVPEKFSYRKKARFAQMSDMGGLLFSVANNFYFAPGEAYHVHYHVTAIPQDKYFKTNPEYFALINGKRFYHARTPIYEPRPQYCLSNKNVQELIYKNALERADLGYKVVEFGQTDGFIPCQCEPCKKMYNTSDWGEKIWRLHAEMAARLEKDRPGVTPAIACYGITHMIPKTFNKFPSKKMIIDVAPATKELLEGWKKFNITGMAAWTYYFGPYLASRYAPSADFDYLQNELKWMATTPVTYLYNCGINFSPALNGPWVYAYGKFCGDPGVNWRKMLKEYCLFAYGAKAAPYMEKFFLLLNERSRLFPNKKNEDFNNFQMKRLTADVLWEKRYPENIIVQLEKLFAQAEKVWIASDFTKRLKNEFTYLVLTARVNNASKALQQTASKANRHALADAIDKREAFFKGLEYKNGLIWHIFSFPRIANMRAGGSMGGLFQGAFNSDPAALRRDVNSAELVKVRDFADPLWAKIPAHKVTPIKPVYPAIAANFKAAYTDNALLLVCTAPLDKLPENTVLPRDSKKLWQDAVWEIFLTSGAGTRQLVFSAAKNSAFDNDINPYGRSFERWNGSWSHKDTVKDGVWRSEVTLPFRGVMAVVPRQGETWQMQVAFSTPGARNLYAWNMPLTGGFSDVTGFGDITFGKRKSEQKFDISNFKDRKIWYPSSPKIKVEYIKSNGKDAICFSYKALTWGALRNGVRIDLKSDEEALFTVTLRGKGKGSLGAGWSNAAGKFVMNGGGGLNFLLSDKPQTLTSVITLLPQIAQKGGKRFYNSIFLNSPGGEIIVEKAELRVRKKK